MDDEDYEALTSFGWYASCTSNHDGFYARAFILDPEGHEHKLYMHRFVMRAARGQAVDHINRATLDNRKQNLRLCSQLQNNRARGPRLTKSYKGTSLDKRRADTSKPWRAYIAVAGHTESLGTFASEEEAAKAYDLAALFHYGLFAYQNFPPDEELKVA